MVNLLRRSFLGMMVAVVVALLGAIPLANASGFDLGPHATRPSESALVWMCGAIIFGLTLAVIGPITRLLGTFGSNLARTESRPTPTAAVGMMACGTLCVIVSLYFAWAGSSNAPSHIVQSLQDSIRAASVNAPGMNVSIAMPDAVSNPSGAGAMILTTLAFALGTGLTALGVWATLPYSPCSLHAPVKRPIPAADATSL